MYLLILRFRNILKIQANDNKWLNLCCAIIKFNFHFRNKLVSLEIRQVKERRREGGEGEATNTQRSLLSTRGRTKHPVSSFRRDEGNIQP